jgi:uridylate kinase
MKSIVISLGGSVVSADGGIDTKFLDGLSKLLGQRLGDNRFVITCGGGGTSKLYVEAARKFGASEYAKDEIAMATTWANALLVKAALGPDRCAFAGSVAEASNMIKDTPIVVLGGIMPGITTDTVAVLAAESMGSKLLINISRVGGIYDQANKRKVFQSLNYNKLVSMAISKDPRRARSNFIFDVIASKLAARSGIELHFIGTDLHDLECVLDGKRHTGTVVKA